MNSLLSLLSFPELLVFCSTSSFLGILHIATIMALSK